MNPLHALIREHKANPMFILGVEAAISTMKGWRSIEPDDEVPNDLWRWAMSRASREFAYALAKDYLAQDRQDQEAEELAYVSESAPASTEPGA